MVALALYRRVSPVWTFTPNAPATSVPVSKELGDHCPLVDVDLAVENFLPERAHHTDAAADWGNTSCERTPQSLLLVKFLAVGGLFKVKPDLFKFDNAVSDFRDHGTNDFLMGNIVAADDGVAKMSVLAVIADPRDQRQPVALRPMWDLSRFSRAYPYRPESHRRRASTLPRPPCKQPIHRRRSTRHTNGFAQFQS